MPAYQVVLPNTGGRTYHQGVDMVNVFAADAPMAKALAAAAFRQDSSDWSDATVTEIAVGTELEGYVFTINLYDLDPAADPADNISVSYTGENSSTIDTVGAALVTALNATAIDGAAYNSGTNALTITETTDGMGDWRAEIIVKAPAGAGLDNTDANIAAGFYASLVDEGAEGEAISATLIAALPAVYGKGKALR